MKAFTGKKQRALTALLTQPSLVKAAEVVGVSEVTLWRYMQDDNFQQALKEAKQQAVEQAIIRIQQVTGEAVEVLYEVMTNPNTPASSRVSAAKTILEMNFKVIENEEINKRLDEIESSIRGSS